MKNLVTTISCSLLLASSAAIAADLPTKSPSPLSVAPAYNWTGFYAGVNAGYGTGAEKEELSTVGIVLFSESLKFSGEFVGGQIGFNNQIGNFVWGVEGDYQKSWQKGALSVVAAGAIFDLNLEVPWFATARLRAGWANGPALFYVTGGGVWTEGKVEFEINDLPFPITSERRNGWTIGAGLEAMSSPQWTWKIEYLYARLRDKETNVVGSFILTERFHDHIVRVGVNYRFGG